MARLYLWHRRLGIAALVLFVILVVTGVMLNHAPALELDQRPVTSRWLLVWYGMEPPALEAVYRAGGHHLGLLGERLFLDHRLLPVRAGHLAGALELDGLLFVVTGDRLMAFTTGGELVESQLLPPPLRRQAQRVGAMEGGRLVVSAEATVMSITSDMAKWRTVETTADIAWTRPVPPPHDLERALLASASPLNLERVVLDLHSGRLFGHYGIYLVDAAALVLLFLGASGGYLWLRRHRQARRTQRSKV